MNTYRNFINGKWIESTSAKTVDNINPSNTADVIGSNRQATRDEARAAVEAAAEAFHSWRRTPAPARGKIVASLPGAPAAVELAMTKLLVPELGHMVYLVRG